PAGRAPVAVSQRVTIIAEPDTSYRVVHASPDDTLITITSGAVTARLWPEPRPHHMVLSGGGITAIATGTIYSLAVRPTGPVVAAMEGTVEAHAGDAVHVVHAHHSWPSDAAGADPAAGYALLALASPPPPLFPPAIEPFDASVEPDAAAQP